MFARLCYRCNLTALCPLPATTLTLVVSAAVNADLTGEWYYLITAGASGVGNIKVTRKFDSIYDFKFGV